MKDEKRLTIVVLKILVAVRVALKFAQHLNGWKDGKYDSKAIWTPVKDMGITAQQNCNECHGSNVPSAPMVKK